MRRPRRDKMGWHVIARGTRRLDLFRETEDYVKFLEFLKYSIKKSGTLLWAYCLMSNHYHLVICATSNQLTACMQRVNRMFAAYHNKKYRLTGHVFEGPYLAFPEVSRRVLLRNIAYTFLNPVAAGIVDSPEKYPWSCYKAYVGLPGSPLAVDTASLISYIGGDKATAWRFFHRAIELETIRARKRLPEALTRTNVHAQQFEWLLDRAREQKEEPADLPAETLAMYWGQRCGISPKAMAQVLGKTSAAVRNCLYRFKETLAKDAVLLKKMPCP